MSRNQSVTDNTGATAGAAFFVIPAPIDYRSQQPIITNGNSIPSIAGCLAGAVVQQSSAQSEAFADLQRDFDNPRYTG
jgi:hypothetical protein